MSLQHCLVVRVVAWFDSFIQGCIGKLGLGQTIYCCVFKNIFHHWLDLYSCFLVLAFLFPFPFYLFSFYYSGEVSLCWPSIPYPSA